MINNIYTKYLTATILTYIIVTKVEAVKRTAVRIGTEKSTESDSTIRAYLWVDRKTVCG